MHTQQQLLRPAHDRRRERHHHRRQHHSARAAAAGCSAWSPTTSCGSSIRSASHEQPGLQQRQRHPRSRQGRLRRGQRRQQRRQRQRLAHEPADRRRDPGDRPLLHRRPLRLRRAARHPAGERRDRAEVPRGGGHHRRHRLHQGLQLRRPAAVPGAAALLRPGPVGLARPARDPRPSTAPSSDDRTPSRSPSSAAWSPAASSASSPTACRVGRSIVGPARSATRCGAQIAAYDNVPVLSWLLLRGRCRNCHARIPARYPLVELAMARAFAPPPSCSAPTTSASSRSGSSSSPCSWRHADRPRARRDPQRDPARSAPSIGVAIVAATDPPASASGRSPRSAAGGFLLAVRARLSAAGWGWAT